MSNIIHRKTILLFEKFEGALNKYNDPVNRAGVVVAIADCMIGALEPFHKAGIEELRSKLFEEGPGAGRTLIAEKGINVEFHINKPSYRLEAKQLLPAILKAGWKNKNGKPLALSEVTDLIDSCKNETKPAFQVKTGIAENVLENGQAK